LPKTIGQEHLQKQSETLKIEEAKFPNFTCNIMKLPPTAKAAALPIRPSR
jgi:hypothetical protein